LNDFPAIVAVATRNFNDFAVALAKSPASLLNFDND